MIASTWSLEGVVQSLVFDLFCVQETGLYEYKIHGAMDDMDPELCAQVYVDWEYRKKWDSYAIGEWVYTVW